MVLSYPPVRSTRFKPQGPGRDFPSI